MSKLHIISNYSDYSLVKSRVECKSDDENLGDQDSIAKCANACLEREKCKYFIYGTSRKKGKCYWEKRTDRNCPQGWEVDQYNFYEIRCMFHRILSALLINISGNFIISFLC